VTPLRAGAFGETSFGGVAEVPVVDDAAATEQDAAAQATTSPMTRFTL